MTNTKWRSSFYTHEKARGLELWNKRQGCAPNRQLKLHLPNQHGIDGKNRLFFLLTIQHLHSSGTWLISAFSLWLVGTFTEVAFQSQGKISSALGPCLPVVPGVTWIKLLGLALSSQVTPTKSTHAEEELNLLQTKLSPSLCSLYFFFFFFYLCLWGHIPSLLSGMIVLFLLKCLDFNPD